MAQYFDIHNHLFNKNFLAKELLYRLLKEMKALIQQIDQEEEIRGIRDVAGKVKEVIKALKRYSAAFKVFMKKNSIEIYKELDETYQGAYILTPLTFDLTYCFAPTPDRDGTVTPFKKLDDVFEDEMNIMLRQLEDESRSLSRNSSSQEEYNLLKEYELTKKQFFLESASLQEHHQENVRGQSPDRGQVDDFDGFNEQIRQIKELKEHPDYREKIFPFLAVDPRRPGIEQYAKEKVGKDKLFIGVKLYCPNGYSPTDPVLYGSNGVRGGVYAFCEDNGIPVTAHNSDGGFATLSKSVVINGLIHNNGELVQVDDDYVTFDSSILGKGGVYDRAATLNHPLIWKKVVEKYPNLILNLAHFGGGKQLNGALDFPDEDVLWSNRIIALLKDKRYKVYTDVSCFSEFDILRKFVASNIYQEIKHRVMYGSDYMLLLLFENDFHENVKEFKKVFGDDFDVIAGDNPREFLKDVLQTL